MPQMWEERKIVKTSQTINEQTKERTSCQKKLINIYATAECWAFKNQLIATKYSSYFLDEILD